MVPIQRVWRVCLVPSFLFFPKTFCNSDSWSTRPNQWCITWECVLMSRYNTKFKYGTVSIRRMEYLTWRSSTSSPTLKFTMSVFTGLRWYTLLMSCRVSWLFHTVCEFITTLLRGPWVNALGESESWTGPETRTESGSRHWYSCWTGSMSKSLTGAYIKI